MATKNPIIVVTGANGGVGFGICQRLLFQLATRIPSDARPAFLTTEKHESPEDIEPCESLTLVMACRNTSRGEVARTKLLESLDARIKQLKLSPEDKGHAEHFRQSLRIEVYYLDLASTTSVFRYPYISRIICNAGLASFVGIAWMYAIKRVLTQPVDAVTFPDYYTQRSGEKSADGLGWVWQCNVFGHYCLFRELEPLLRKSPDQARVLWMSSLEGVPQFFDLEDWQLLKSDYSYQGSKYQMDLIASCLDARALKQPESRVARHFIVHPAVTDTNVASALAAGILDFFKLIAFYAARILGSPNHPITPFKAAISAVHVSLVSLALLPLMTKQVNSDGSAPIKFGSETDWWGHERVGKTPVLEWEEHKEDADALVQKCDALYQSLRDAEGELTYERASEHM